MRKMLLYMSIATFLLLLPLVHYGGPNSEGSANVAAAAAIICPPGEDLECFSDIPPPDVSAVVVSDFCGTPTIEWTGDTNSSDDCANGLVIRTYSASDDCGNFMECTQEFTYSDNTPPVFDEIVTDITVQCADEVPPMADISSTDNCVDAPLLWAFDDMLANGDTTCVLSDAVGPGVDWSMVLFNLPGSSDYFVFDTPGTMELYDDGTAMITGTVQANDNPDEQWILYITLENKRNWNDWSALGRDYKDDLMLAGDNYLDWSYYELDNENSFLLGDGDFTGSFLELSHMPASYLYGFQVGYGANNKNANYGMSGWFHYDGVLNGASVSGHGDINVDKECEASQLVEECEYTIDRQWIAVDDCGNVSIMNQTITVADTIGPDFTSVPENLILDCYDEIPAVDISEVEAVDNCGGLVTITVGEDSLEGDFCQGTLTRTFEALDNCGNLSIHIQTITFNDDLAPVLTGVPQNLDLSCEEGIPPAANVTALDNCDGDVTVEFTEENVEGDCPNAAQITRTWSATDVCGNNVTATQIINTTDDIAPVFTNCPADVTADCYSEIPEPNVELLSATDDCGDVSIVHISDVETGDACDGTLVRTYRATDECGNSTDCVQTFSYQDDEAPVFVNPPANTVANCDNLPDPAEVVATDNCGEVTIVYNETLFSGGCLGDLQRMWVATDECGNSTTYEQFITLIDTVAPVLNDLPENAAYECDESIPAPAAVTATDNCDASVIVSFEESIVEGDCPEAYTILRTWSAIDTCENTVSYTQTISIDDTTAPVFDMEDSEETVSCDTPINIGAPVATDNCDTDPTVELSTSTLDGDCPNAWTEIMTWTATDDCGNTSSVTYTINYVDDTAPVFTSVPDDIAVECGEDIPTSEATASDDCGDVVVTSTDSPLNDDECEGYIVRTFTATDECGNTATATQNINIIDTTAPVITSCPADASYDCIDDVPAPNTALVSASDNCSSVSIVHISDVENGDDCIGSVTRTYRATDECGNSVDCVQTISFEDDEAPVFVNPPANTVANCDNLPDPAEVVATDNCGEVSIVFTETLFSGGCLGDLQRMWVATDECGNSTTYEQFITLIDTVAPVLENLPANASYECDESIPAPAAVTASDNCDASVIVSFEETIEEGDCPEAYTIFRTWSAIDTCENTVSHTQVISIDDTTAPVFDMEDSEETVACDAQVNIVAPVATDNCDADPTVELSTSTLDGDCPNAWTEIHTWTATDNCGNSSSVSHTINYVDEIAPVFTSVPDDIAVECDEDIPATEATASDNCGDVVVTSTDSPLNDDECEGYIVRTFTATDECGNTATATQNINIIDTTAPVITACPADASYDCIDDVPAPNTALVSASDNCSSVSIVHISDVESGDDCVGSVTRTYRATDECGNSTDCVQIISYEDTIAPVFVNAPVDGTYDCASVPDPAEVEALDNCGEVTVTFTETEMSGGCPGVLNRIWTATDECGNTATHEQLINLIDTVAPVLENLPENVTIECDEALPLVAEVTATDNCDDSVIVEFSETTEDGNCAQSYSVIRTWTATDTCENSVSHTQVINIEDNTAPVFDMEDSTITVDCNDTPSIIDPSAFDNCDADVEITSVVNTLDGECANEWSEVWTWTATDDCGNSSSVSLTINYVDETAPVFTSVPDAIAVECDEDIPASEATASDDCGDVVVTSTDSALNDDECAGYIIRTFTATDACGNTATAEQTINIIDNTAPVITACPADASYDCIDDVPAPNTDLVSASDNCSSVSVVHLSDVQSGDDCVGSIARTYRATDECGNVTDCVQTISFEDEEAPVFIDPPANTIAFCDDLPDPADVVAIDNCSEVSIVYTETLFSGGCIGDLQRMWVATDECGNSTTYEQFITLTDDTAPVLANLPDNAAYECDEAIPAPANVTATDNCDTSVLVEFSETTEAGDCDYSYTILRTWSAVDTCENSVSHTQVITIDDTTAPVLSGEDDEITVDCASDYQLPVITATDNCDADVDVSLNSQSTNGDCPGEMSEVHTWTAVDDCGNTAIRTLVVNYVDDTEPVFTQTPEDWEFDCIEDVPAPDTSLLTATDNCGDVTISFIGDLQFGDDCEAMINRVYRATDECGNYVEYTQDIEILDNIAPTFNESVENLTVECDAVPAPANITASDNCSDFVDVSLNEATQDGECEGSYILTRTWTASDDCDNSNVLTQIITVEDNTAPVFVDVPEDASYDCEDDIPVSEAPVAIDNCSSDVTVTSEQFIEGYTNEDGLAMCELTTPLDVVGAAWALWLPNNLGEPQYYFLTEDGGQFNELQNGQAHLTGTVYAPTNPGKRWVIDVYFDEKKDWEEWSALGRSYKDDAGVAGDLYETWDYYILNADSATLTGEDLYAGSLLNLEHAPASYYFGFQVGEAANNRNAADGMSGWFYYDGIWNDNAAVTGIGDFGFEYECAECDYTITNIWTAVDDCGNSTTAMQVITVQPDPNGDNTPEQEGLDSAPGVLMTAWPNPAANQTRISFTIPVESRVTLEIYNIDGKLMESLFTGVASANMEYRFDFEAGNLSDGLYIYKLTTDKATYLEKLMIAK